MAPRVRYYAAQSLDGYIAETDHTLGWLLEHDQRTAPPDPGVQVLPLEGEMERFFASIGAVVVGARTYEYVLREGQGWPYGQRPTWVLTHRDLPVPEGADVRMGALDAPAAARAAVAAAGERDLWVLGGGPVAQDLADAGLLDTVEVTVVPVVLGAGVPLFSGRLLDPFVLTGVQPYANGMVHLTYRLPTGAPR
jgi:dihydrofolate reductase